MSPALRILVVDDNEDAAEMLALALEAQGHTVVVAADGGTGLEQALASTPEVAFLDIGLPVRDGYELARAIRALPECSHTVLVAVSGYGQPEDIARATAAGFDQHHVKPITMATVIDILASVSARTPPN